VSDRLQQWKARSAAREIELSDGLTMVIRPVRLENLVLAGRVPLTLVRQMQALKPQKDGSYRDEDALKMADAINAVVLAAAVDPAVTRDGSDDSVALDDIPFADRVRIFEEANRPAAALQSFRGQPDGDADPAPDGEGVRPAAE
jgi:hypothetical protein